MCVTLLLVPTNYMAYYNNMASIRLNRVLVLFKILFIFQDTHFIFANDLRRLIIVCKIIYYIIIITIFAIKLNQSNRYMTNRKLISKARVHRTPSFLPTG